MPLGWQGDKVTVCKFGTARCLMSPSLPVLQVRKAGCVVLPERTSIEGEVLCACAVGPEAQPAGLPMEGDSPSEKSLVLSHSGCGWLNPEG